MLYYIVRCTVYSVAAVTSLLRLLLRAGQRTADAILEESFRVAREVVKQRMGGKKSSGVSEKQLPSLSTDLSFRNS